MNAKRDVTTTVKCQHERCEHAGDECTIKDEHGNDVVDGHYCGEHAALHGFCPCCGDFWGGISSFEMNGICDHCKDELDADEHDGCDDDFDYEPDYPDDYDDNEPVGSCDNCDSNIYPSEDDGSGLCDQCQWYAAGGPQPQSGGPDE
jgi:hypothetical protein